MWSVASFTPPHSPVEIYSAPPQHVQYPQVTIHANGKNGGLWGSEAHRERMQGSTGLPGEDADVAYNGKNGGTISVTLYPNPGGGFIAEGYKGSKGRKPFKKFVPSGFDLFLSARGGDGEDGGIGGDGEDGCPGDNGDDATEDNPAEPGEDGGDGGNAGRGSHGGDGGNGGVIEITVDESHAHLLYAICWDISEGRGGTGGRHGEPGSGGEGGQGGAEYSWYDETGELRSYEAAPDGLMGEDGIVPYSKAPRNGYNGKSGTASIYLQTSEGTRVYTSAFDFQLNGFDIVDENEDGIFEPGECVVVRAIYVSNIGDIPTPAHACIPIRIRNQCMAFSPDHLSPMVSMPPAIPEGATSMVEGNVRTRINFPGMILPGTVFRHEAVVQLEAAVPDLCRPIDNFDYFRGIVIEWPIRADIFKWLDVLSAGSSVELRWTISNISTKDLGSGSSSKRKVQSRVTSTRHLISAFMDPKEHRKSNLDTLCYKRNSEYDMPVVKKQSSSNVSCRIQIPGNAPEYSTQSLAIQLMLSPVSSRDSSKGSTRPPMVIQTHKIDIIVSSPYKYNPESQFLLVTNQTCSNRAVSGWRLFIKEALGMSVDVWDVSQFGGLILDDGKTNVLSNYKGKSVIILNSSFDLCHRGQRDTSDFLSPKEIANSSLSGTTFTFIQHTSLGTAASDLLLLSVHQPIVQQPQRPLQHFNSGKKLIDWLKMNTSKAIEFGQFCTVSANSQLFRDPQEQGERLAIDLRREFPTKRFLVAYNTNTRIFHIWQCLSKGQNSRIWRFNDLHVMPEDRTISSLQRAEAYACVGALPMSTKLDILNSSAVGSDGFKYPSFVTTAAKISVMEELHQQVPGLEPSSSTESDTEEPPDLPDMSKELDYIGIMLQHPVIKGNKEDNETKKLSPVAKELIEFLIQSAESQNRGQVVRELLEQSGITRPAISQGTIEKITSDTTDSSEVGPLETIKKSPRRPKSRVSSVDNGINLQDQIWRLISDPRRQFQLFKLDDIFPETTFLSDQLLLYVQQAYEGSENRCRADYEQTRRLKRALNFQTHG